MPQYEYRCKQCQFSFSRFLRLDEADTALACPACRASAGRRPANVAFHRSEASRLAAYDHREARRPEFFFDAHNIGLGAKRRLLDSGLDLGPRVDEIIERGRSGAIFDDVL